MLAKIKDFWKKRKIWIIIGIIVIALIVLMGSNKGDGENTTYVVEARNITEQVEVAGKVQSNDFAELGFEVNGKISNVLVDIGDEVKRGQTLVRLDTSSLQADLADAQASVSIKQAELSNTGTSLEAVIQQQDVLVNSAYKNMLSSGLVAEPNSSNYSQTAPVITGRYSGPEGYYKITVKRKGSSDQYTLLLFGVESANDIQVETTSPTPIGENGLFIDFPDDLADYSGTTWYVTIPNVKSSVYTTNYNTYQQALRERDRAIDAAEAELRGDAVDSIAQAELIQAQARVARIQSEIAQHTIRAPFDGVVGGINAEIGEIVSVGGTIVSVVSDGDFEIELEVPEIDVSKIEVGNIVDIKLDAFGSLEMWQGEITAISQAETYVDGVPVYQTNVRFTESDDRIRSGLSATVMIMTESRDNVIAVPSEYIDRDEDGRFVNVVLNEDETERRNVMVGLRGSDGFIEVIEGLSEGEKITTAE